jgi:hypothetical protein
MMHDGMPLGNVWQDMNPEGLTAVTGKWADALATRLRNGNLSCHVRPPHPLIIRLLTPNNLSYSDLNYCSSKDPYSILIRVHSDEDVNR